MPGDESSGPRRVRVRLTHARTAVPRPFPTGAKKTRAEFEARTDEATRTTKRAKPAPSAFDYLNDEFWATFCGALDPVALFELACASPHAASSVEFAHAPNVWWDERLFGPGEPGEADRDYRHVPRSYVRRLRLEKRVESPEIEGLLLEDLHAVGIDWVAEGGRLPGAFRRLVVEGVAFAEINERVAPRLAGQSVGRKNVAIESLFVKSRGWSEREVLDLWRFSTLRSLSVEIEDVRRLSLNEVPSTLGVLNVKRAGSGRDASLVRETSVVEAYWGKHTGIRRVSATGVERLAWLRVPTRLTHFHGPCVVYEMAAVGYGDPPVDEYYSSPRWETLGSTLRHLTGLTVFDANEIYDDPDAADENEEPGWYHRLGKLEALETADIAAHPELGDTNLSAFSGVRNLSVRGFALDHPNINAFSRLEVFSADDVRDAGSEGRISCPTLREVSVGTREDSPVRSGFLTLRVTTSLRRAAFVGVPVVLDAWVEEGSRLEALSFSRCLVRPSREFLSTRRGSLLRLDAANSDVPADFFLGLKRDLASVERVRATHLSVLGGAAETRYDALFGPLHHAHIAFFRNGVVNRLPEVAPRLRSLALADDTVRTDPNALRLPPSLRAFRWMTGAHNVAPEDWLSADVLIAGLETLFSAQIVEGAFPIGSRLSRLEYFLPLLAHYRDSNPAGFAKFLNNHPPTRFRLPKELPPFLRVYGTDVLHLSPGDETRMPEEVLADVLILEEGLGSLPTRVVADRLDATAGVVPEGLLSMALGSVESDLVFPSSADFVRLTGRSKPVARISLPSHAVLDVA